jgi:diaminopimelate decarboxylase
MKNIAGNTYLKKNEDQIIIDAIPINKILNLSETPFMIFLENRIKENLRIFNDVFKSTFSNFEGYYSFKANYLPEICQIIQKERFGAELISLPELNLALSLGYPPNKIILGGPYLPNELIQKCVKEDIKEIIVYDLDDLEPINTIAKLYGKTQNICLRIKSKKFGAKLGISPTQPSIERLKRIMAKSPNIRVTTILSHYTTQMNNFEQYRENIMTLIRFYEVLRKNQILIDKINLGGGFPEASIMQKDQLRNIAEQIKLVLLDHNIDFNSIYFEPGRYLVGDSGLFIAKILKKTSDRWIFLDIGNHICPKFARCSLRFYNVSRINEPHKYKTSIAGIIPSDQDVLAKNYFFTKDLMRNDKVMILNVGAYCLTFSNRFPYFLPKIYLINGENVLKIFDQDEKRDFFIK